MSDGSKADRHANGGPDGFDIRIAVRPGKSGVRDVNHLECGDRLQPPVHLYRHPTAADCEVVEPRAPWRQRNRCIGDTHVELEKGGHSSPLVDAPSQARRDADRPGIVSSLRYVVEALTNHQHEPIAQSVRDPLNETEQFFMRWVVVPGFERALGKKLRTPASIREGIQ